METVLAHEGRAGCTVSVCFVTDGRIRALNRRYKGVDRPTDVLAFPMQEGHGAGITPGLLGDVVVSVETARREARVRGIPVREELLRYAIHGLLHLVGYRDHAPRERRVMRRREHRYLGRGRRGATR